MLATGTWTRLQDVFLGLRLRGSGWAFLEAGFAVGVILVIRYVCVYVYIYIYIYIYTHIYTYIVVLIYIFMQIL